MTELLSDALALIDVNSASGIDEDTGLSLVNADALAADFAEVILAARQEAEAKLAAAEAEIVRLREALAAMRTWFGIVADKLDLDPDDTCVNINADGPDGKRQLATRSMRAIFDQADAALKPSEKA